MKTRLYTITLLLGVLWSGPGCKSQDASTPSATAPANAKPGFENLSGLEVVSGKFEVKVSGGSAVELLVDGAAVGAAGAAGVIAWDTSRATDGIVRLALRRGASVTKPLAVVVLNRGSEAFFKSGSGGKVVVPLGGYQTQHLRYHWDMGKDVKRVVAILSWDKPGFDLELTIGQGMCPNHGKQLAEAHGTRSPVIATHAAGEGFVPGGQWFGHVQLMNAQKVLGQETSFTIKAFLLR